jgi:D-alanyl-D-alanine dipeptidase
MGKKKIYEQLASKILSPKDYEQIRYAPQMVNSEFAVMESEGSLEIAPAEDYIAEYAGKILVRKTVAMLLEMASNDKILKDNNLGLRVMEGYRPLEIQKQKYAAVMADLAMQYPDEAERRLVAHNSIAIPELAGHPTGGAVDVGLVELTTGQSLDFGTDYLDFSPDSMTFSPFVSPRARRDRMILRAVMLKYGFTPFDGEWWHFSSGDIEWAAYRQKNGICPNQTAYYPQVDSTELKILKRW